MMISFLATPVPAASPLPTPFTSIPSPSPSSSSSSGVVASLRPVIGVPTPLLLHLKFPRFPRPFFPPTPPPIGFTFFFLLPTSTTSPLAFAAVCAADRKPSPPETRSRSKVRICFAFFLVVEEEKVRMFRWEVKCGFRKGRGVSA